jgi:hypothetical protein
MTAKQLRTEIRTALMAQVNEALAEADKQEQAEMDRINFESQGLPIDGEEDEEVAK